MIGALKKLTVWDAVVVAAGVAVVVGLQVDGSGAVVEANRSYTSATRVEMAGAIPRRSYESAVAAFEIFRDNPAYHGAFAIGAGGGFGRSDNYGTQAGADASALATCEGYTSDCQIIARLSPVTSRAFEGVSLSYGQARQIDTFSTTRGKTALAFGEDGHWGLGWNYWSRRWAEQTAMEQCRARELPDRPELPGKGTCRVVLSR